MVFKVVAFSCWPLASFLLSFVVSRLGNSPPTGNIFPNFFWGNAFADRLDVVSAEPWARWLVITEIGGLHFLQARPRRNNLLPRCGVCWVLRDSSLGRNEHLAGEIRFHAAWKNSSIWIIRTMSVFYIKLKLLRLINWIHTKLVIFIKVIKLFDWIKWIKFHKIVGIVL